MMLFSTTIRIHPRSATCAAGVLCTLLASATGASAQCTPEWTFFYPYRVGVTFAMNVYDDDGAGPTLPALYEGGQNYQIGALEPDHVVRFDGLSWSMVPGLGSKTYNRIVKAFVGVGDEHPNPEMRGLWAGGNFDDKTNPPMHPTLARWDGAQWQIPPTTPDNTVHDLVLFDDNTGGPDSLFVSGVFTETGTLPIPSIARWDGTAWSELPGGPLTKGGGPGNVKDLYVWDDDGDGPHLPELYVLGGFNEIASGVAQYIAKWNGTQWSSLAGYGTTTHAQTMIAFDADGPGPEREYLYVGGGFRGVGGPTGGPNYLLCGGLVRWDGSEWSLVPGWDGGAVWEMAIVDFDGDGPDLPNLCVGGVISQTGGKPAEDLARWDGKVWEPILPGQAGNGAIRSMIAFDEDGPGPNPPGLYVGGDFTWMGGEIVTGLARWGCPIEQRCVADCDHSTGVGKLDIFDFLCFQQAFVLGNPAACDCDVATGYFVCDIFDFLCFQNAFVVGCP